MQPCVGFLLLFTSPAAVALLVCGLAEAASTGEDPHKPVGSRAPHEIVELASGLSRPWSLSFLPDGSALITERTGGLRVFRDGVLEPKPVAGLPEVFRAAEGGLLGLEIDPAFENNRTIYLCITRGTTAANASAILRARFDGRQLTQHRLIFEARPLKDREQHFGCRLVFAPDGTLLMSVGDGYHFREQALSLESHLGKVLRLRTDGSIPVDNPYRGHALARQEIFTSGHRNMQGMAVRPGTREIWVHEHGPRGGDEINVLRPGANYGWPAVTFGIDYSGEPISARARGPEYEAPRFYWVPSIAPSGMAFYEGNRFPEWRGDLFVGALAAKSLRRLDIEGSQIVGEEILLASLGERIREVETGPDGLLYLLTDAADGKLLRIQPPDGFKPPDQAGEARP
jgi:glucose/arabinose dehydrogenase